MARLQDSVNQEERMKKLFAEVYSQVETEITQKHIAKQREPIIISLKPFFEPSPLNFIFFYDHESKADLKMLTPRTYTETEWNELMTKLWSTNDHQQFICPTVPVAFAKFTRLTQFNQVNPMASEFEYVIDFYTQEELDKLTAAIENYEIVNYAKKADYQNQLLALKDSGNFEALRNLQRNIQY